MKKEISKTDFVLVILFIGIILSGTCFFGTTMFSSYIQDENREVVADEADPGFLGPFFDAVYDNKDVKKLISNISYSFFREISDENVIAGSNGFVFEIKYEGDGYDYLRDYMGEISFSNDELITIAENIERRRDALEKAGKRYIIVVVPTSMRVYDDCLPLHYGKPSKNSRLSQLSAVMVYSDSYIDLTDALTLAKTKGYVYNNTEDSINALGAYTIYRAVEEKVNDGAVLCGEKELKFYTHLTPGKSVVRRAGASDIVKNRTVSYTDDYRLTFNIESSGGGTQVYTRTKPGYAVGGNGKSFIVAVDSEIDIYRLMPFFSNAYRNVSYVHSVDDSIFGCSGDTVVEFVSERNLSSLLDMADIDYDNYRDVTGEYEEN